MRLPLTTFRNASAVYNRRFLDLTKYFRFGSWAGRPSGNLPVTRTEDLIGPEGDRGARAEVRRPAEDAKRY